MAIKKISEFTLGTPTASDKILFEQSGAGKSTTISNAVNTCSLSLEEIQATTDLTGKIASANALKKITIKEKAFVNNTTDTNGNIYIEMSTSNYYVLSAVTTQMYVCSIALYGDGSKYYVKVFNSDGTLAPGINITNLYVHYVERY